jgi:hypothetical protein
MLLSLKSKYLPVFKMSLRNYFSFFKSYNLVNVDQREESSNNFILSTHNSYPTSLSHLPTFKIFYKNMSSFFLMFGNSFFLKNIFFNHENILFSSFFTQSTRYIGTLTSNKVSKLTSLNLYPSLFFRFTSVKSLLLVKANMIFRENLVPWVYTNLIQFIEFCSGRRALFHVYSFMNQSMDLKYISLYKR